MIEDVNKKLTHSLSEEPMTDTKTTYAPVDHPGRDHRLA